ncbi:MAG: EamA family transporter RarD [Anaerolineales bacterium]|nr:EamA family transporter RarD [Anaerolineae bacterium]PWB49451.1 MAG: EamA family transporter RarD [Anaerolineales bacterium]
MNKGILAGIGAYVFWGLFPIYWRLLESVPAIEILAHRVVWSLVFMLGLLLLQKDLFWWKGILQNRRTWLLYTMAAILLSANWFTYIWAVNAGYVVEASLGYFINPLVNFMLGVIFFKEKLRGGQLAAVILAVLGVLYLTFNYGSLPWISLVLAFTFGMYGLIKKIAPLESMHGFSLETAVMFLPALAFLLYRNASGMGAFAQQGAAVTILLILAGPVTSIPLLMFGFAVRRITLSLLGFLQYIAPTLQFLLGVYVYHEPFPTSRLVGFCIIWLALLLYSLESVYFNRKARPSLVEPL